jgi:ABC-2 type transport system ATP-binding protein
MGLTVGLAHPTRGTVTVRAVAATSTAPRCVRSQRCSTRRPSTRGAARTNHLLAMGAAHGIGKARVREVIKMTSAGARRQEAGRRLIARNGPVRRCPDQGRW